MHWVFEEERSAIIHPAGVSLHCFNFAPDVALRPDFTVVSRW